MGFLHDDEWGQRSKLDFYLAQIACEVHNIAEYLFAKKPTPRALKDFLLDFIAPEEPKPEAVETAPPPGELSPEEEWKLRKQAADEQRLAWADFLEVATDGNNADLTGT